MNPQPLHTPVNLTATAFDLPQLPDDGPVSFPVLTGPTASFELWGVQMAERAGSMTREHDEIFVIIAGQGALICGGEVIEFTDGDVLLLPARVTCRFVGLSRKFQTWRILLGDFSQTSGGGPSPN